MKTCFRCNITQPLTEFYAHPRMADGLLNKCKTCAKSDTAKSFAIKSKDPNWVISEMERHRIKQRKYRKLGLVPTPTAQKRAETTARYRETFPEKVKAHWLCQRIPAQPCSVCGKPNAQKHHEDYSKPLAVTWLCSKHHAERHVEMRRSALLKSNLNP